MTIYKNSVYGGLFSSIIGDVLGVPVEFKNRDQLLKNPVGCYIDGKKFGYVHKQPLGTWSDDTSLILCTIEGLLKDDKNPFFETMKLFYKWYNIAYWTATDVVFDVGKTTANAIDNFRRGFKPIMCGLNDIRSNGNGSLMRILPVAYWCIFKKYSLHQTMDFVFDFSGLTHNHIISKIACLLYTQIVKNIVYGFSKEKAIDFAHKTIGDILDEKYQEEWNLFYKCNSIILNESIDNVKSSGYVVDTLEVAIYSFLRNTNIIDSLTFAVNLGGDADTNAVVTGGLSGSFYGYDSIPFEYIEKIKKIDEISKLIDAFFMKLLSI